MSGYADDYSRSNRALEAEAAGMLPASRLARKLKIKTGAIKALLRPCEWHHTSSHYNCTDYYDEAEAKDRLEELRVWQPPEVVVDEYDGCRVDWLEWAGSRQRPIAVPHHAEGCHVRRVSSAYLMISLPGGREMRKKIGCIGLKIKDAFGKTLYGCLG